MFGQVGIWQILILAIVVLVFFGRGRISEMMGDFGKGINSFKQGLNEDAKSEGDKPAGETVSDSETKTPTDRTS